MLHLICFSSHSVNEIQAAELKHDKLWFAFTNTNNLKEQKHFGYYFVAFVKKFSLVHDTK